MAKALMIVPDVSSDILALAATEVFDTMVFLELQPVTELHRQWSGDSVLSCITFHGAVEGCFGFSCPVEGAATLAQSMLGLSPTETLSHREIHDAMGEVTHMVMGRLKTLVADILGDIQISIPMVIWGQHLEHSLGEEAQECLLGVTLAETYPAALSLYWHA